MSALFPLVPNGQGVPPVRRQVFGAINDATLLVADLRLLLASPPTWGIYKPDGSLAVKPDSFYAFGVRSDKRVSNFPIEQGSFGSFNKVSVPGEVRVVMTKGGTDQQRRKFLDQVADLISTFDLMTLVIPEGRQRGYTCHHYDYERKGQNGVWLLEVELLLQLIKQVPVNSGQNTRTAAGAAPLSSGQTQPINPASVANAQSSIGQALTNVGTAVVNVADQIVSAATSVGNAVLGAGASALSFVGDQLSGLSTAVLGSSVSALPGTLLNAGYSACEVSTAAAALVPSVAALPVELSSSLLPQLAGNVQSTAAMSQQLLTSSSILSAGGTIDGATFSAASTRTVVAPVGSQTAGILDSTPGPVKVGDVMYGPVFPYRVQ